MQLAQLRAQIVQLNTELQDKMRKATEMVALYDGIKRFLDQNDGKVAPNAPPPTPQAGGRRRWS